MQYKRNKLFNSVDRTKQTLVLLFFNYMHFSLHILKQFPIFYQATINEML